MNVTAEEIEVFYRHGTSFDDFARDILDIETTITESKSDHFFESEQEHLAYLTWMLLFDDYAIHGVIGPTKDRCGALIDGVRKIIDMLPYRHFFEFKFSPYAIQTPKNRLSTVLYDPTNFRNRSLKSASFIGMSEVKRHLVLDCLTMSYLSLAAASWKGNEKLLFAD